MRFPISVLAVLTLVSFSQAEDADHSWQIHGQVVDEQGTPVEDFEAATFWLSNGNIWDEHGELLEEYKARQRYKDEGVLAAVPRTIAERHPEGSFSLKIDGHRPQATIFAVDQRHERGGIAMVEQSEADQHFTITMAPLVRVTAEVYCSEAGRMPDVSNARVSPLRDTRVFPSVAICLSRRGKISFLLPPGTYGIDVHSSSPDATLPTPKAESDTDAASPPVRGALVEVPRGETTLDLGVLDVVLPRDKDGIARDNSQFYGKEPPELAITDARGVPSGVKLSDLRGKWVLLEFWAVWCSPCVYRGLPELTAFYEEHAADRDRFEILAICNTSKEEAHTIEEFDALVAPLVEDVWAGKQLPFPVLIDGEGKTSGVYGIQRWPTALLIDPDGNLVNPFKEHDGAEAILILAEKLREEKP